MFRIKTGAWRGIVAAGLLVSLCGSVQGQATFTLGFNGPDELTGNPGTTQSADYDCVIAHTGGGNGAQGWSVSLLAENGSITSIAFEGSQAEAQFSGGFKKSELTTPPSPNPMSCPGGLDGAVSAIVLSFVENRTIPADATTSIAKIGVSATIPDAPGTATLRYVNGCRGSGQPVDNNITQDGATVTPVLGSKEIALVPPPPSCCIESLNVGFSGDKVSSATAFDGIVDGTTGCNATGGEIRTFVAAGATGQRNVYAAVSSSAAGGGAQGWSFSIAVNDDVVLNDAKVEGTPGVDENFSGGFKKTEVIDPTKPLNGGQRGLVSAIVLSFVENRVLPATGTEAVLDVDLSANAAQGADDIVGEIRFKTGLQGSGQPVQNAVTVDGATVSACNFETARADVVFALVVVTDRSFVSGNANGDRKVNIADPIWIINQLFRSGPSSGCDAASDANGDDLVDASDATYLIAYMFNGGAPPAGSFPGCDTAPEEQCAASQASCP